MSKNTPEESKPQWRNRIVEQVDMPVGQITANAMNWRKHPRGQAAAMNGIIDEVGLVQSVVLNRRSPAAGWPDGTDPALVDGHLRLELAKKQGEQTLPVTVVDLSEAEEKMVLATFDPIGGLARSNDDILQRLLPQIDAQKRGVRALLEEMYKGIKGKTKEGEPPEPKVDQADQLREKWKTETGQLWVINSISTPGESHRLLCGDSTSAEDVRRLMNGKRARLFATDPPYLVDYNGTNHPQAWGSTAKRKGQANKDWSDDYKDWDNAKDGDGLYDGFVGVAVAEAIDPHAAWYCWHASPRQAMLEEVWERHGARVHQQIIWVKDRSIMTRTWYHWQHEPCFYGWIKGNNPDLAEGAPRMSTGKPTTVWQFPTSKPGVSNLHPTQKPVELFAIPMRQHLLRGELCYEPFSGSGTQLIAAEQEERICYAMERSPQFVAVALERLSDMGLKPELAASDD